MRLIDADALKERMGDAHFQCYGNAIMLVMDAPTVDAAPVVHGRWLSLDEYARKIGAVIEDDVGGWAYCSECGQPMREFYGWGYCPDCGARMDLKGSDKQE